MGKLLLSLSRHLSQKALKPNCQPAVRPRHFGGKSLSRPNREGCAVLWTRAPARGVFELFYDHLGVGNYSEIDFAGRIRGDPVEDTVPGRRRVVLAWVDIYDRGSPILALANGWTHAICDQLLTLRKSDDVKIRADLISLKTFAESRKPFLYVLAPSRESSSSADNGKPRARRPLLRALRTLRRCALRRLLSQLGGSPLSRQATFARAAPDTHKIIKYFWPDLFTLGWPAVWFT
jgi:hypothetical protein